MACCPPLSRKRGDIKSHSSVSQSVRLSVSLSVTKTLTLAITFALLQVELWYLPCGFIVTLPFWWYHVVTLTVTFDLLQGQICCRAGDHNSLNLLVLRSNWTCRIWFRILSWRDFCIVVSDFAYLLPFSNNFPLKFLKNIHSGFTLVDITNNSACSIDVGLWLKLL